MLAHTPFDGSSAPFTIGLKPLNLARWLEVDRLYEPYVARKDELISLHPGAVFAAEPGTEDAQREALQLVRAHLERLVPDLDPQVAMSLAGRTARQNRGEPALQAAARLVQEDLVLMRRGEDGWRLVAASLCFPSSWSLGEKFGKPLADVHAPVPGFGRGTRPAAVINRIFDNLKVEHPVERLNWSLQTDSELFKPRPKQAEDAMVAGAGGHHPPLAGLRLRVERQTLRRLERSGDILFTIRIHLDPLGAIAAHPDRIALALAFAGQLAALTGEQLAYKGIAAQRDSLVATLREMAKG